MQSFKIKVASLSIYSFSSAMILLSGMFLGVYMSLSHASDIYFFILILFGLTALVFVPDLISTALTEWEITEKEIKIKWLSQFLFHKKTDKTILWEDIEQYKFQPEKRFSFLELKLRDNTALKYWHSNSSLEDGFSEFLTYFQKQVFDFNEKGINILYGIRRGKTIYETRRGIVFAIATTILLVSFPILLTLFKPPQVDWIYIIPAYSSGIYFISQVVSHNRKKKQQQHKVF